MHKEQPGISILATASPKMPKYPSALSFSASILVGGATHKRVGRPPLCCATTFATARKWPMLVMHEPMKTCVNVAKTKSQRERPRFVSPPPHPRHTSSILVPCTSDNSLTSSGSLGQARMGSLTLLGANGCQPQRKKHAQAPGEKILCVKINVTPIQQQQKTLMFLIGSKLGVLFQPNCILVTATDDCETGVNVKKSRMKMYSRLISMISAYSASASCIRFHQNWFGLNNCNGNKNGSEGKEEKGKRDTPPYQPGFHVLCTALKCFWIAIPFRNHPAKQHNV